MPETTDSLKSLKPFRDILESSEADYRNAAVDERGIVIGEIMTEIREVSSHYFSRSFFDHFLNLVTHTFVHFFHISLVIPVFHHAFTLST